jgi:inner membrane protein
MIEYLGWAATVVFVGSYFCRQPDALRRTQMLGAAMWIAYGLYIRAPPVAVANLLVLLAAMWTRRRREDNETTG